MKSRGTKNLPRPASTPKPESEPTAKIRVRLGESKDPEFSAEDLRASGDSRLTRLAMADLASSPGPWVEGNEDGWVSRSELERSNGLGVEIKGGFLNLVAAVQNSAPTALGGSEAARLMALDPSDPVRPLYPKPAPVFAADPIRTPAKIDYRAVPNASSPALLRSFEQQIEAAIGADAVAAPVTRGFSLRGFGGPEMVKNLFGDWRCMIGSYTFTQTLRAALEKGEEFHSALLSTATEVSAQVVSSIEGIGYEAFAQEASRHTQLGIADKRALGMSSFRDSLLDAPVGFISSFGYAFSGLASVIATGPLPIDHPMVVVEVEQKIPRDYVSSEYLIASHIPPTKVQRFCLGFSTWHDAYDYLRPPVQKNIWYEVEVVRRDADQRPAEFKVTPLQEKNESRLKLDESWDSAVADGEGALAFEKRHPLLAGTLDEIRRQLAALRPT